MRWLINKNGRAHLLSRAYDTLQSALVLSSGSSVADGDGGGEDGLDVGSVEVHNHRLWQVELLQLPQEEHPLFELLLSTVKTNYIYYLVVVIFIFFPLYPGAVQCQSHHHVLHEIRSLTHHSDVVPRNKVLITARSWDFCISAWGKTHDKIRFTTQMH